MDGVTRMKWIKCSDRLPAECGDEGAKKYLVFTFCTTFAYYIDGKWLENKVWPDTDLNPTHWCELPEKPE